MSISSPTRGGKTLPTSNLAHKTKGWRPADPPVLLEHVRNARAPYKGTEDNETKTDQFRRCVRYLRRWDDVAMAAESGAKPSGLAFVLLCRDRLTPTRFWQGSSDDRGAFEVLANSAASEVGRLIAQKPTPEYEDMFARLSDADMKALKSRFRELADALQDADAEPDPVEACKILQRVFGPDFPVPKPQDTGEKTKAPAIVPSSSSA
jgi:hypothetical protein